MAQLYRVILMVTNIDQAEEFYSRIFDTPGERVSSGRHYFDCGGTILACYDPVADGDDPGEGHRPHPNQYLYFAVSNVDEMRRRLIAAGITELSEIATMPWRERLFYAVDPFGNRISFVDELTLFSGGRI